MIYSNAKQEAVPNSGASVAVKASGLEDVALQLQHTAKGAGSNIYVAIQGTFSPEKGRDATLASEGNQASGGISVTPRVGLSSTISPSATLAVYVSYRSRGERVRKDNGTPSRDYTVTGSNQLSIRGLLEFQFSQSTLSIGVGSIKYETSTSDYAGAKTSNAGRTDAIFDLGSTVAFNEATEMVLTY